MKCPHCGEKIDMSTVELPEGFEEFWALYPRKIAKPAAVRAWKALRPNIECRSKIRVAIASAKRSLDWMKAGGTFIPYPATFLNQRRWEDQDIVPAENEWTGIQVGDQAAERRALAALNELATKKRREG